MNRPYIHMLVWFGVLIVASVLLYHTSNRVASLDIQLRSLNTQIESEQQALHVLKAEWVYLSNPTRIDEVAKRHLNLQPTAPKRVVSIHDAANLLPLRSGNAPSRVLFASLTDEAAPAAATQKLHPSMAATASTRRIRMASDDTRSHINDRVIIQRTAAASGDSIGSLISSLSYKP